MTREFAPTGSLGFKDYGHCIALFVLPAYEDLVSQNANVLDD
jgi:hypothetical protein